MVRIYSLTVVVFLQLASVAMAGGDRFVSTTGNDANAGTEAAPWLTIQHAADIVGPGTTVFIRAGVYGERVTVNVSGIGPASPIVFRSFPGETAIIDGAGLIVPDDVTGLILIVDRSWITIEDLELRNYRTSLVDRVPVGIHLRGAASHVTLRNVRIHDIETNWPGSSGGNAHGIAVYGTDPSSGCRDILIEECELYDLTLGSSEAMVLNGNVSNFVVRGNHVHHCDNIGIDCIGFEGTCPDETVDQARDGLVVGNLVEYIDSISNPAYGGERSAGGIYVDGGRDIIVDRNVVHHANIGIELASEHAGRSTRGIVMTSNLIYHCHYTGIALGGYDAERGSTEDCLVINNTLYENDTDATGTGELLLQFDVRNTVIRNNVVHATSQNVLLTNPFTQNIGNTLDNNLYWCPGGAGSAEFEWKGSYLDDWAAYRAFSGNDSASTFDDPQFVAPGGVTPDLHLSSGSPGRDAGDDAAVPATSQQDLDGAARIRGTAVDIGCYEAAVTCAGDIDGDGAVSFDDLINVLASWGPCPGCPADIDLDGAVGFSDLLLVLGAWGPC